MLVVEVKFCESCRDEELKYAVIASRYEGQWVLCKHRMRTTLEMPGGTREDGERIDETARRELFEETGAVEFLMKPVSVYSVCEGERETKGMLYMAEIRVLGELPESEIEKIVLMDEWPGNWTYPLIQPFLLRKVEEYMLQTLGVSSNE